MHPLMCMYIFPSFISISDLTHKWGDRSILQEIISDNQLDQDRL